MPFLVILMNLIPAVLLPRWSRRGIYFGLTVSEDFANTAAGRALYRRYVAMQLLAAASAAGLTLLDPAGLFFGILLQLLVLFGGFALTRRQLRPHQIRPDLRRQAVLAVRASLRNDHPMLWCIGLLPLLSAACWIALNWAKVPDPIPMHYNAAGNVDRWEPKSPAAFVPIAFPALVLNAGLYLSACFTARARRISVEGAAASSEQMRLERNLQILVGSQIFGNVVLSLVLLGISAQISKAWMMGSLIGGGVLFVAVNLWIANQTAQLRTAVEPAGDGTEDRHWLLGMVYANPQDAAMMVEHRTGIGYTLNFAHPLAWVLLAALMAPAALALWMR